MAEALNVRTVFVSPTLPPLQGVQLSDGQIGATLRSLCSALQLNPNSQRKRIARTSSLRVALASVTLATAGGLQEMDVLLAWVIPLWVVGIQANRLDTVRRARVLIIQTQAVQALYRAFWDVARPVEEAIESEGVSGDGPGDRLEARLAAIEAAVRDLAGEVAGLTGRVKANERVLAATIERVLWLQQYVMQRGIRQGRKQPGRARRGRPRRSDPGKL